MDMLRNDSSEDRRMKNELRFQVIVDSRYKREDRARFSFNDLVVPDPPTSSTYSRWSLLR